MSDGSNRTPPPPVEMASADSMQLQDTLVRLSEAIVKLGSATQSFSSTQESYTMLQQQASANQVQPGQADSFMQKAMSENANPMANAEIVGAMREMNENLAALKDMQQQNAQQQLYTSSKHSPEEYSRSENADQISALIAQMQQFTTIAHTTSAQTYMGNGASQQINDLAIQSAYAQARPQEFSDSDMQEMAAQSRSMYQDTQLAATNFVVSQSLGARHGGIDSAEFAEVMPMMNEFAAKSGQTVTQVGELLRKLKDVGQISADVGSGSFEQIYMGLKQLEGLFDKAGSISSYVPQQTLGQRASTLVHSRDINAGLASGYGEGYDAISSMVGGSRGMEQRMSQYSSGMMSDTLGYLNTLGSGDYEEGLRLAMSDYESEKEFSDQYIESAIRKSKASENSQTDSRKALEIQNRILMYKNEFGMSQSEAELAAFGGDAKAVISYRRLHKNAMGSAKKFADDISMAENQVNFIQGRKSEESEETSEFRNDLNRLGETQYGTGFNLLVDMAILDPLNDKFKDIRDAATKMYDSATQSHDYGVKAGESTTIKYDDYDFVTDGLEDEDGKAYNIQHTNEISSEYISSTLAKNINFIADISASLDTEAGVNYTLRTLKKLRTAGKISEQDIKRLMIRVYTMYTTRDTLLTSNYSKSDVQEVLTFIQQTPLQTLARELSNMLPSSHPIFPLMAKVVGVSVLTTTGNMSSERKAEIFGEKALQNLYAPRASSQEDLIDDTGTGQHMTDELSDWMKSTASGAALDVTGDILTGVDLAVTGVALVASAAATLGLMNAIPVVGQIAWVVGTAALAGSVAYFGASGLEAAADYYNETLGSVIDKDAISEFAKRNIPQIAKEKILIAQTLSSAFDYYFSDNHVAVSALVKAIFTQYRVAHIQIVADTQNNMKAGEKADDIKNEILVPESTLNRIVSGVVDGSPLARSTTNKKSLYNAVRTVLFMINDKASSVGNLIRTGTPSDLKEFLEDLTNYLSEHQPHTGRADETDVNTAQQLMKGMDAGKFDAAKVAQLYLSQATYNKSDTIDKHIANIETAIRAVSLGSDDVDETVKAGTRGINDIKNYLQNPEGNLDLTDDEIEIIAKIPGVDASQLKNYIENIKKAGTADEKRSTAATMLQYIDKNASPVVETANMKASLMTDMIVQIIGNLKNMSSSNADVEWILKELG